MRHFSIVFALFFMPFSAGASDFFPHEFPLNLYNTKINVGTYSPRAEDSATVIYLHGFADTMNNHEELLSGLHDGGMRVISFDYPSHGKSEGNIWFWSVQDLGWLVRELLSSPTFTSGPLAVDRSKPLIFVGWSTGATLAIRISQVWASQMIPSDMRLAGVIGFAPGLPARAFVGDGPKRFGVQVKAEDLTRSPSAMKYSPRPGNTLFGAGPFAVSIKGESEMAYWRGPTDIPTLLFISDNQKDFFANSRSAAHWVSTAGKQVPTFGFQCPGAYHGIEFEPESIGELTRNLTIEFAQRLAQPNSARARREIESSFRNRTYKICPSVHLR